VADARAGEVVTAVREATGGGAHLSLDALGSAQTCVDSVLGLRPRGRHVQVGLLPPSQGRPLVPMERVVALELELLGSHGMAAHAYPELLELVVAGRLRPDLLVTATVDLAGAAQALAQVGRAAGITVLVPA
jgi:alcohol dehydrogenase